jgi:peptide/nickel transport system substrate-binding protein
VRAAMVQIGEADLAPELAKQDATNPAMDVSFLNSETTYLIIGAQDAPLNDRRVRLAVNYALDRNAIQASIVGKDAIPATQMVLPSIVGHNPTLKVWPYDPKKARQLLDEARKDGVPVDKEILLVGRIGYWPNGAELMEAVLTMYKEVGLNVKLKMMETGAFRAYNLKPFPPGPYIWQNMHDNSYGDAVVTVMDFYHCKGSKSTICDQKLDAMLDKAQVSTGAERKNLWQAAFKRIYEENVSNVMLFHMVGYARVGTRINFKPTLVTGREIELGDITFRQ